MRNDSSKQIIGDNGAVRSAALRVPERRVRYGNHRRVFGIRSVSKAFAAAP